MIWPYWLHPTKPFTSCPNFPYPPEDISNFLAQQGITSRGDKNLKRDRISFILSNPFYVGLFRYAGEIHEGKHQPVISKKIFDKVQEILKQRGRPHHKTKNEPQVFCGLLHCGTCGMGITGEYKVKHQKNGNEHYYVYYHCTRKIYVEHCLWAKQILRRQFE